VASEVRWWLPGGGGAFFSTRYVVRSVFSGRVLWEGMSSEKCAARVFVEGRMLKKR